MKSVEKKYFEMGILLMAHGFVCEVRFHFDNKGVGEKFRRLDQNHSQYEFLFILVKMLFSPFLIDSIEEKETNRERISYRTKIFYISQELYDFYESNKLHASNLSWAISAVEELEDSGYSLSKDLVLLKNKIKLDLSGGPDKNYVERYKLHLSNKEKLHLAYETFSFVEDALLEIFEKIEKNG